MSIESVTSSNHLILCRPLLLLSPIFPSIRVFSSESVLHIRWPEYWSFSFSISPSNEYLELISLRTDWLDLLWVQGSLNSLLQHCISKASILWSHIHTWLPEKPWLWLDGPLLAKSYLIFNKLSRLVITFLPRSKRLLITWLQSPSAMIWEPPKIKSLTVSTVFPSIFHEVMGPDAMILVFWMLSFKPAYLLFSFTFIKRLFSPSFLSAIRVVVSVYLRLLIFLPAILILACASSNPAFHMMYSA